MVYRIAMRIIKLFKHLRYGFLDTLPVTDMMREKMRFLVHLKNPLLLTFPIIFMRGGGEDA